MPASGTLRETSAANPAARLEGHYCIFSLDRRTYAVESGYVQGTLWVREVTPLPVGPPGLRGLLALRGRALPVIELAALLECRADREAPGCGPQAPRRGLIVGVEEPLAILPIDRIEAIWPAAKLVFKPCVGGAEAGVLLAGVLEEVAGPLKAGLVAGDELIRRLEHLAYPEAIQTRNGA